MNCTQFRMMADQYADGEVDGLRAHSIERHLRECPACTAKSQEVLALRKRIRAEVPYFAAPVALRGRVSALVAQADERSRRAERAPDRRWRWLSGGALAGCAATLLAWVVGTSLIASQANEDVAVDAVATHVRATLNDHLIEVTSSDQHTVKPWLSARLDYSPPVQDFASDGFALIGGRIDTIDRQRVATLVYRYRLHNIDVFVRPDTPAHAPAALRTIRGFNVAHATGAGMDWLAVSDVSPDVLTAFVEKLAANGASKSDAR